MSRVRRRNPTSRHTRGFSNAGASPPRSRFLWIAAASLVASGCATGFIPSSEAVNVVVDNRSDRNVLVKALHHTDLVDFAEEIPRREQRAFRVSHRAFGSGPVTFEFLTGPGRLGSHYQANESVRIPPGSLVTVIVREDPRLSTIRVLRKPDLAGNM